MNRIKGVGVAEGFKLNRPRKNREKRKEKKRKML